MYIPTSFISWGHISQGQDVWTLRLTLHVVSAGKKLFKPLDLSVDIKTILGTCPVTSTHLSLPLLPAAKESYEDPARDRKT